MRSASSSQRIHSAHFYIYRPQRECSYTFSRLRPEVYLLPLRNSHSIKGSFCALHIILWTLGLFYVAFLKPLAPTWDINTTPEPGMG